MNFDNPKFRRAYEAAQRETAKTGKSHAVLTLNPFSPLYVCREYNERMQGSKELVCIISEPEGNTN